MLENLYQDVKGDLRIAWEAHHSWSYVVLMYQDWQREAAGDPVGFALVDQAYHDFEAELELAKLRTIFDQAEAFAVWVCSKNDFSPEGEREFRMAINTAKIAKDNLWRAEQKAATVKQTLSIELQAA